MFTLEIRQNNFPIWLCLWTVLFSLVWLLPNHYYPWATFHSDAWTAIIFTPAAFVLAVRGPEKVKWHYLPILFIILACVPFLQFAGGMLPFAGQAWLASLYIIGLSLAMVTGSRWELTNPGKAADGLFFAIGIASFISVYLQLRQWTGLARELDEIQFWTAEYDAGRPSANLAQPNQLATLLIWGLLACAWAVSRKKLRPSFAICGAIFLLFGIVLTQSRMAIVVLFIFTCACWVWRPLLSRRAATICTFLFCFLLASSFGLQTLNNFLSIDNQTRHLSLAGESTGLRLSAYAMFVDALTMHPWVGYGWSRLAVAQLTVAQNHPNMAAFFLHSHNLFLDLALWCGIPLGLFIVACLLCWYIHAVRNVKNVENGILILFLTGVGIHAMVELPLHHAYFLLPTGLIIGILNQRIGKRIAIQSSRVPVIAILISISLILAAVIRDYLRVDESFRSYRLEMNHVGNLPPLTAPSVYILDDMSDFIATLRTEVSPDISDKQLKLVYRTALSFPSPFNLFNYARALAFRHRSVESEEWLKKIEKVQPTEFVKALRAAWAKEAETQPAMAAVSWPIDENRTKN
jgi:O-antigen ligase